MAQFKITIDHTKVSSDLTDFPIYVDLSDMPSSFWSTVSNGGGDIRCYKSDGTTELPREVVSCDTGTDTGELHVKYSGTLSSSVDTEIVIDVDGVRSDYATDASYGAENVWTNNYAGVWHLNTLTGAVKDSTGNGNDGVNDGMWTDPGKLGVGVASDGSTNYNRIEINPTQLSMSFNHTDDMTTTAWVKPNSWSGRSEIIGSRRADSFGIGINSNGTIEGQFDDIFPTSTGTLTFGSWNYVSVVHNGDASSPTADFYINGVYDSSGSSMDANGWATQGYIYIGHESRGNSRLNGVVDEIRVARHARSADWISTEYNNQGSPGTFYDVEELNPNSPPTVVLTTPDNYAKSPAFLSFVGTDPDGDDLEYQLEITRMRDTVPGAFDIHQADLGSGNNWNLHAANRRIGIKFKAKSNLTHDTVYFLRGTGLGTPPTYRVGLQADNNGQPSGTFIASATYTPPDLNAGWASVDIGNYSLTGGQVYWLVIQHESGTVDSSNRMTVQTRSPTAGDFGFYNDTRWTDDMTEGELGFYYDGGDTVYVNRKVMPIFVIGDAFGQVYYIHATGAVFNGRERGQNVVFDEAKTITGFGMYLIKYGNMSGSVTYKVYDDNNDVVRSGTVIADGSVLPDSTDTFKPILHRVYFSELTIPANTMYRLVFASDATGNGTTNYYGVTGQSVNQTGGNFYPGSPPDLTYNNHPDVYLAGSNDSGATWIDLDAYKTFDIAFVLFKGDEPEVTDTVNSTTFPSGQEVSYTVNLVDGNYTYRVRARDPSGTNTYGDWTLPKYFTLVNSIVAVKSGGVFAFKPTLVKISGEFIKKPLQKV